MLSIPPGVRRIFVGLFLDEPSRFSAYSIVGRVQRSDGRAYQVLRLNRFPTMSEKVKIAEIVGNVFQTPYIISRRPTVTLCSVVGTEEMIRKLRERKISIPRIQTVDLTGGMTTTAPAEGVHHVPKIELSMTYSGQVETGRIKLDIDDPEIEEEFRRQMAAFSMHLKRRKQIDFEEEEEDIDEDLVLSVAVPIWYAETRAPSDKQRASYIAEPW